MNCPAETTHTRQSPFHIHLKQFLNYVLDGILKLNSELSI